MQVTWANPNANAKDTNHNVSGVISGPMNTLAGVKKKNCGVADMYTESGLNAGADKK